MRVHELSGADARRIAARAQLLCRDRPAELIGMVGHLTLLQADQTAAVAPTADQCRLDILDRLGSDGPLPMRDLPDTCAVPWRSTGWTNNRLQLPARP